MLKAIILGFNGKELQVDDHGNLQSVHTGSLPTESEANDGYYDNVLLMGKYQHNLLPILINEEGELL